MSKHIPGPWTADSGDNGPFGVFDANGAGIAYMAEPNQRATALPYAENGRYRETDWDAHQSNARLIAAAPEMLEVLEWLDRKGGLGLHEHERIRNVITKAKKN